MIGLVRCAGHTYAFRGEPLEHALDRLAGIGFRRVELWVGHARAGPDAAAAALAERGLTVAAVGAGGFYDDHDLSLAGAAFELAAVVGAPIVVACAMPELLGPLERRVPAGLVLCVENHWDQRLARPREMLAALAGHPRLGVCLDTGHALMAGVRPERFAAALGPRLGHVHLKDARRTPPLELALGRRVRRRYLRPAPVAPGGGALDPAALLTALRFAGFAGTVSLEHEGAEPAVALARLRQLSATHCRC